MTPQRSFLATRFHDEPLHLSISREYIPAKSGEVAEKKDFTLIAPASDPCSRPETSIHSTTAERGSASH
jgi:hypothetical protein